MDHSVYLLNNTHLFEYFLELDFPIFSSYQEDHHKSVSYWFLWDEELPWLPVQIAHEKTHFYHGITFVRRSTHYYDMIAFALPELKLNAGSYYMIRLKALETFIEAFEREERKLLEIIVNHPILLTETHQDPNFQDLCLEKNFQIPILTSQGKTYMTPQELSCARLRIRGYGYKEIGQFLCLSPRTVETYLERLKRRTGILTRGDLKNILSRCP